MQHEEFDLFDSPSFAEMKSILMDSLAEATVASVDTVFDEENNESLGITFDNGARIILEAFYLVRKEDAYGAKNIIQ